VITCTVVSQGKIYALSSYLSEFVGGVTTRQDFTLTRVTFPQSVEPLRIIIVILFISVVLMVYLKQ
jgi:hypothetical protein